MRKTHRCGCFFKDYLKCVKCCVKILICNAPLSRGVTRDENIQQKV